MSESAAQEVLRELSLLREDNASLRRELALGFKRVEAKIHSLEHRAPSPPAAFPVTPAASFGKSSFLQNRRKVEAAASRQPYTCWEDDEEVKRFLYKGGWLTEPDLSGQWGPRRSELSVIADALDRTKFNGAIAVAEAQEGSSSSPPRSKKAFNVSDSMSDEQRDDLNGQKKGVSFFHNFLGTPEKGLDGDERRNAPREQRTSIIPTRIRDSGSCLTNGLLDFFSACAQPLHPASTFRTRWDLSVLLLLLYVCFTAPVIVCFDVEIVQGRHKIWYFETFVTIMFAIDIFLNLNTAYFDNEDKLVTKRRKILWAYLSGWMIVDLLAVIPYEMLTPNNEAEAAQLAKGLRLAKFTRILRVLRVIKLLRIFKVPALIRRIEGATGRGVLRSIVVIGGAVLITHLAACGFFYVAHLQYEDSLSIALQKQTILWNDFQNLPEENKTAMKIEAWEKTWVGTSGLATYGSVSRYITALYWAMSTLTTVGYGDVTPANDAEKLVSMLAMVIGVTVFAYFMGNTASLIAAMNSSETVVHRKLSQMDEFLRQRHVPRQLTEKIRKFYNLAVHHQVIEDDHMVNQLSMPLRTELLLFLYRNTLEKVPFFKGQDPQFITSLVSHLRMEYYAEGDIVVQEGDLGNVMYFVVSGFLEARQYNLEMADAAEESEDECVDDQSVDKPVKAGMNLIHKLKKKMGIESDSDMGLLPVSTAPSQMSEYRKVPKHWRFYSNVRDLDLEFDITGQLFTGEHFGEYSCLLGHPRTSTVVALDFCELYSLSQEELMEVYRQWPELHKEFQELVHQFQEITGMTKAAEGDEDEEDEDEEDSPRPTACTSAELPGYLGPATTRRDTQGLDQGFQTDMQNALKTMEKSESVESEVEKISASATEIEEGHSDAGEHGRRKSNDQSAKTREKNKKSMKNAVNLMMNMQQFEKLSTNPVFQLLNNGHDLRGVIDQSQRERRESSSMASHDDEGSVRLGRGGSSSRVIRTSHVHEDEGVVRLGRVGSSARMVRTSGGNASIGSGRRGSMGRTNRLEPIADTGSPLIKAKTGEGNDSGAANKSDV